MARAAVPPPPPEPPADGSDAALRAQILATEHWSLLASRSTTQSEVLLRIQMLLTFCSAVLVSLALVGQATDFDGTFRGLAVALLGIATLVGALTTLRVYNVGMEDLAYVLAMNRLRGAYHRLVPGIEAEFLTSPHDDRAGSIRTYYFLGRRGDLSQVLGSSMVFSTVVVATLAGLFAASAVVALGGATWLAVVAGVLIGIALLVGGMLLGGRAYARVWRDWEARYPSAS